MLLPHRSNSRVDFRATQTGHLAAATGSKFAAQSFAWKRPLCASIPVIAARLAKSAVIRELFRSVLKSTEQMFRNACSRRILDPGQIVLPQVGLL